MPDSFDLTQWLLKETMHAYKKVLFVPKIVINVLVYSRKEISPVLRKVLNLLLVPKLCLMTSSSQVAYNYHPCKIYTQVITNNCHAIPSNHFTEKQAKNPYYSLALDCLGYSLGYLLFRDKSK